MKVKRRDIYTCRMFLLINFNYHLMGCDWHNLDFWAPRFLNFIFCLSDFFILDIELARDALNSKGYCVIGGYMSPVNDAYKKKVCHCLTKRERHPDFIRYIHLFRIIVKYVKWFSENTCLVCVRHWSYTWLNEQSIVRFKTFLKLFFS